MARYNGPKARVNRRLGALVYETAGAARALEKRDAPPGMHKKPRRPTDWGKALNEKQKIKHYYGLGERQLRRFFEKASSMKGNTGEQLLILCERRLDNVIRRAGFTKTRPQARQGVVHGHFLVNGEKVDKPSYLLRAGDIVSVKAHENLQNVYRSFLVEASSEAVEWVSVDQETLSISMAGLPGPSDISLPVNGNTVVEFLSR